jgi:cytochrome b561
VPADAGHLSLFGLVAGELTLGYKARRLSRELTHAGLPPQAVADVAALTLERAVLLRRIAYLQKTKKLFGLWHVFHTPFAYVMIIIVGLHIGVTLYLGYIPFRW